MFSLAGKYAVVTGAGSGIGKAIALALAKQGAFVDVLEVNVEAANDTVEQIRSAGGQADAVECDVSNHGQVQEVFDKLGSDRGGLDCLVNNAGIASRGLSVADTSPEEVDKLFAVHAAGPHRLSRLALPQLRSHARSDIIVISSIATYTHSPNGAPYTMAKAAGEALAYALAKEELGNGVRVNIVAPALTVSDMGEKLSRAITGNEDIHHLDTKMPFGRVAVPADVAAAVVWFVSGANSYCSGQKLNIDGAGQATFR